MFENIKELYSSKLALIKVLAEARKYDDKGENLRKIKKKK